MGEPDILQLIDELREDIARVFNESETTDGKSPPSAPLKEHTDQKKEDAPKGKAMVSTDQCEEEGFQNITGNSDISEDVRKMRSQLKHTYELLISARDALEGIDFGNLKNRIKHLRIDPADAEIDEFMLYRPFTENIEELTNHMRQKFKDHPKEFEDIPELNSFFRTCSQLQIGLEKLTQQTEEYEDLEKRVLQATEGQEARIVEIQSQLKLLQARK